MSDRVPVTLLSGFLGSGKTTLLNRILVGQPDVPTAVVVNEFGSVGIDGRLVVASEEDIVELSNGCVCCTIRGDLALTLGDLLAKRERKLFRTRFERIVIESSGMASPGPVVQTLEIEPTLVEGLRLDGVVTLCNTEHVERQLTEHPEAAEQIAYADRIVLNHVDRCDAERLESAAAAVRDRNALADQLRTSFAELDVARMVEIGGREPGAWQLSGVGASVHSGDVATVSFESDEPLDFHAFKLWIQFVANRRSHDLMRVKGLVRCHDRPETVVVQGMYDWLELSPGEEPAPRESCIVFIGRDLDRDELERGWNAARRER